MPKNIFVVILEKAKEVFRRTVKPIQVYIDTKNVENKSGLPFVMPKFHNEQMAKTIDTIIEEERAKEEYVTGYFEESTQKLCMAFDNMKKSTEVIEEKEDLVDVFDTIAQKMEELKRNSTLPLENNPHESIDFGDMELLNDLIARVEGK